MIALTGVPQALIEASAVVVAVTGALTALYRFGPLRWLWARNVIQPAEEMLGRHLAPVNERLDGIDGRLDTGAERMGAMGAKLSELGDAQAKAIARFDSHEAEEASWRSKAEALRAEDSERTVVAIQELRSRLDA